MEMDDLQTVVSGVGCVGACGCVKGLRMAPSSGCAYIH